jgi:hypothetical protein
MATTNGFSQLDGLFKQVYADKIENLVPSGVKLYKLIKFAESEKLGNMFNQPVILGHEHGFTYGGSSGDTFLLNEAVAAAQKNAQVQGFEMVLRSYVSIGAVSRSLGAKNSSAAFIDATKLRVESMYQSFMKRLEIQLFHGQMGLGSIASGGVTGNTITLNTYDWAPGIWIGSENCPLEIRDSSNVLRGFCTVSSVSLTARTVTVDALPAGTAATDIVWFKGAYGNEFPGVHKILTSSSTLFGINSASYSLWTGNVVPAGTDATTNAATLALSHVELAVAAAMEKGLDENVVALVNPRSWSNLLVEQAAKRMYDQSWSQAEVKNGSKSIKFFSQVGEIEVIASIYVKEGFAYVINPDDYKRIGSRDISFDLPGLEGMFMIPMPNANALEIRCYTDQSLFTSFPGQGTLVRYVKS